MLSNLVKLWCKSWKWRPQHNSFLGFVMLGSLVLSNRNYKYRCLEVWSADKKLGSISNTHHFWRSCWDHEAEPSHSNHDWFELPKVTGTSARTRWSWKTWLLGLPFWPFGLWSVFVKPVGSEAGYGCDVDHDPNLTSVWVLPVWRWVPSASFAVTEFICGLVIWVL